jgi:hypothetical protein
MEPLIFNSRTADGLEFEQIKCRVDIDTPICPAKAEEPYWSAWGEWGDCEAVVFKVIFAFNSTVS